MSDKRSSGEGQRAPEPRCQELREAFEKLHRWTYEASNETVVLVKLSDVLERLAAAEPYHCTYCDLEHAEADCPQRCKPEAAAEPREGECSCRPIHGAECKLSDERSAVVREILDENGYAEDGTPCGRFTLPDRPAASQGALHVWRDKPLFLSDNDVEQSVKKASRLRHLIEAERLKRLTGFLNELLFERFHSSQPPQELEGRIRLNEALWWIQEFSRASTHWDGCEESHPGCARIKQLERALTRGEVGRDG